MMDIVDVVVDIVVVVAESPSSWRIQKQPNQYDDDDDDDDDCYR
jgi:hypothetical protein